MTPAETSAPTPKSTFLPLQNRFATIRLNLTELIAWYVKNARFRALIFDTPKGER